MAKLCTNGKTPSQNVHELLHFFSNHDLEAGFKLLTEDFGRRSDHKDFEPMSKPEYMGMMKGFVAAFPDFKLELVEYAENGNTVWMEFFESGTWTKPWPGMRGTMAEQNNKFYKDHNVVIFEVTDEGLIREMRAWNTRNFLRTYDFSPKEPGGVIEYDTVETKG